MKSYKLTGIERMGLFDEPIPSIKDTDVLVQVERVGICGSDVHYFAEGGIGSQRVQYPWTVGHEGAGVVAAVGAKVSDIVIGDRIAFDPAAPCQKCDQCLVGRRHTCTNLTFLGCPGQVQGCLCEYIALPSASCLKIGTLSLEEAAMVEPLSIALYAATLYGTFVGAKVGILGCGPIGLSLLQVVRAFGAQNIFVSEKILERQLAARRLGAGWAASPLNSDVAAEITAQEPDGLDVVFECCGQQEALDVAVKVLKPGGELSIVGIPEGNRVAFDINLLRRKELRIQNVRRQNNCMIRALEMIAEGKVDVHALITHRFNFDRTPHAFDLVRNYRDGVIKAMISIDQ